MANKPGKGAAAAAAAMAPEVACSVRPRRPDMPGEGAAAAAMEVEAAAQGVAGMAVE